MSGISKPVYRADLGGSRLGETGRAICAGTNRRATKSEPEEAFKCTINTFEILDEHAGLAGPFLPERDRRCILHWPDNW